MINSIKDNISQILALTEKSIKLEKRFKLSLIISYVAPIFGLIMPLIIMSKYLEYNSQFGAWNATNFLVYQLVAYKLGLTIGTRHTFPSQLNREKYWKTFFALIIAPLNRINMLFGIFIAHIIMISIPFIIFFILCYLYYPISFITILFMLLLYFLLTLLFSGVGVIIAIFQISKENIAPILSFFLRMAFFLSCVTFPFEIFPAPLQMIINLNPFYYIFDIVRLSWIEDNPIYSITLHSYSFFIVIIGATLLPFIGTYIFNKIYRKYGIVGY